MSMVIGTCAVYLTADWVTSLKEKRSVVKGIVERAKHKFNISIAEFHTFFVGEAGALVHNGLPYSSLLKMDTQIYRIVEQATGETVYIGRTIQTLAQRFS